MLDTVNRTARATVHATAFGLLAFRLFQLFGGDPDLPLPEDAPAEEEDLREETPRAGELEPLIRPNEIRYFPLISREQVTHNSYMFRFELPLGRDLGLAVGQHILVCAEIDGEKVRRAYTPVSTPREKGFFDLLVKVYPNGKISNYLSRMPIGDAVAIAGPRGRFAYEPNRYRTLGMIAGGSGITPMLQIMRAIAQNENDATRVSLIYANVSEDDILLRADIDDLVRTSRGKVSVYYVLNNPPLGWSGGVGFVSAEMIREHLFEPGERDHVLLCGPPPMVSAMNHVIKELWPNVDRNHIFKF